MSILNKNFILLDVFMIILKHSQFIIIINKQFYKTFVKHVKYLLL